MEENLTILRQFDQLYKEMDDIYHDLAVRLRLSDSALNVFLTMHDLGDGCLQRDISQRSFMSKQTIHSSVRKLCAEGYLTMEPGRGRDMHLTLTEAGRQVMEERAAPVASAELRAFGVLTGEEQRELLRLTKKYVDQLRRETQPIRLSNQQEKGENL